MKTVKQIFDLLAKEGSKVESIIIMTNDDIKSPNSFYLTKFNSSFSMLYLFKNLDKAYYVTDSRYFDRAKVAINQNLIEVLEYSKKSMELIAAKHIENKTKSIGFEGTYVTYDMFSSISQNYKKRGIKAIPISIDKIRYVKEPSEIMDISSAIAITERVMMNTSKLIKIGMSEIEVAKLIVELFAKYGAHGTSFDPIVAAGINGANPHHEPSEYKIQDGDFVTLDIGCKYNGYCSDITRTFKVGKASNNEVLKLYEAVKKAQDHVKTIVKPGIKASFVHEEALRILNESGYGKYFSHALGHSLGILVHEDPNFAPNDETILEPGMVLTNEPGLYLKDVGGVRIEDVILVTKEGCQNLVNFPNTLIKIG